MTKPDAGLPELLPCPFCGGEADWGHDDCSSGGNVSCTDCGAKVYQTPRVSNERDKWNARHAVRKQAAWPELPKSPAYMIVPGKAVFADGQEQDCPGKVDLYTADQMRAYAQEALNTRAALTTPERGT